MVTLWEDPIFQILFFCFYLIYLIAMEFGILRWEWTDLNVYN